MSNTIISYQNRIDAATFGAYGSWSTALPLTNIQNRQISKVARTTNNLNSSTRLRFSTDISRIISTVGIIAHNLTSSAKWRYRVYSDSAYTSLQYDSGQLEVWPQLPYGSYEWEDVHFWDLTITDEEINYYTKTLVFSVPVVVSEQYYQLEFFEQISSYVEIGRLFFGSKYQPVINMSLGASIGYESPTLIDTSMSGSEYFDRRDSYRVARFTLDNLTYAESILNNDIMKISGTDLEVLYIWDDSDSLNLQRRAFLGRLRTLSPISQPYNLRYQTSYEIKELL